ncbi:hypothetical protein LCGC14_0618930 [marine sediment metagenome]|uniref:Uncharacterized protein n=1 Tax=marine sediment metagenome TaxID=412755 RepID=A0A0F9UDX3_9ZZZZ
MIRIIKEPRITNNNKDYYYSCATHLCLIDYFQVFNCLCFWNILCYQNNDLIENFGVFTPREYLKKKYIT